MERGDFSGFSVTRQLESHPAQISMLSLATSAVQDRLRFNGPPIAPLCYIRHMRFFLLACALAVSAAVSAFGQACPNQTGPSVQLDRTLEGQLVFHDGIRKWFELKLDEPQCEQTSIQLIEGERAGTPMEVFRGCRVRSQGRIDFSPTGYYSLEMYQDVRVIESVAKCERQSPFPGYSKVKPDKAIREYRVDMHVIYGAGDHPIVFRVTYAGMELRPWQAYASYWLTGGLVLYGLCGDGFVVDNVFGTPEARPDHFDEPRSSGDMAMFDPERAAAAGKKDLRLGYSCVRSQ